MVKSQHYNYIFTLKNDKHLTKELKRYFFKGAKRIYVSSYEIVEKSINFKIYNFEAFTKKEYFEEFTLPKSNVVSIEAIVI